MTEPEIKDLLKQYLICKRFIDTLEYKAEYFNCQDPQQISEKKEYEARMHVIKSLIQLLKPSDEYTLLHFHYITGLSVEKCALSMNISRRNAFRIFKKAHLRLCDFVNKKGEDDEQRAD